MKNCHRLIVAIGFLVIFPAFFNPVAAAGPIVGIIKADSQMRLVLEGSVGKSYLLQSNPSLGTRYWRDSSSEISPAGSIAEFTVPTTKNLEFFRVLEFSEPSFWYDWDYYQQTPYLSAWGLGATLSAYVHNDRPYEWYIDQANTGPDSENNCGPSTVAMAIKWYNPNSTKTAENARNTYPRDHGWWFTSDIINYLNLCSVPSTTSSFSGTEQLKGLLNEGNLLILCISTESFSQDFTSEHRVGRFYNYASGHFLVVKGWRAIDNSLLFETYDSNNWRMKYANGTPKGRNRHLPASEIATAIPNWWDYVIVVKPPAAPTLRSVKSRWINEVDPGAIEHNWGR
jgi:hypothetical protein